MSEDFTDSLGHLSQEELRMLVVALVRQLGGSATISARDADSATVTKPLVQIFRHEYPRHFTIHLRETVSGEVA